MTPTATIHRIIRRATEENVLQAAADLADACGFPERLAFAIITGVLAARRRES